MVEISIRRNMFGFSTVSDSQAVTGCGDEYADFTLGQPGPVCIPGFGLELPFGQEMHFLSDILVDACGWEGYPSNTPFNLSGVIHRPWCFWMGGEVWTKPLEHVKRWRFPNRVQLHLPSFMGDDTVVKQLNTAQDLPLICNSSPKALSYKRKVKDKGKGLLMFNHEMLYGQTSTITDSKVAEDPRYWQWSDGKLASPKGRKPASLDDWPIKEFSEFRHGYIRNNKKGYQHNWEHGLWKHEYSLTTSDDIQYSAEAMCSTPRRIVGPDWANVKDRKYCILSQRRVIDWCTKPDQKDCFDDVKEEIRPPTDPELPGQWLARGEDPPRKLTKRWDYD
jgi:hypothetical protein